MNVVLGNSAIDVLYDCRSIDLQLGESAVSLLYASPGIDLQAAEQSIDPLVCDDVIDETWTMPTIATLTIDAIDLRPSEPDATVRFDSSEFTTAGSPCRAWWKLVSENDADVYAIGKNNGVDSNTQPDMSYELDSADAWANRDCYYHLYWKWTSGSESIDWTLHTSNAVYAPLEGEGDTHYEMS